jgi:hypothetical protein
MRQFSHDFRIDEFGAFSKGTPFDKGRAEFESKGMGMWLGLRI